ncbi:NAD-dependent epimerase/dehydratase family protein [Algoriphagus ratkowskyi]|uniref:NAD-dependent epimerase/dehydratase family protein n=1 Tax=Algoriphagus ratkowskyi TaxID=57028 RepID=A0A2W7QY25_9BACT|nr:NAD-dependent epimerase/dehydratase family protein [Algoriphagus ratkowskyi]PZX53418.1 NAD-dependent epimerase/dehydratase family protein [Algoriphagus ratkowskyi]TXD76539.1 NAD-dependent epimerase/dehydratase family protein [Algoriphagus ratkowskyi]
MKIALISGASGLVGKEVLHQLFKNSAYDYVLSIGRRKLAIKQQKLVQIEGDMTKLGSWKWEDKITSQSLGGAYNALVESLNEGKAEIHAFSSLGTTIKQAGSKEKFYAVDHELVIGFANWAKKLGASKFLYVSSSGADMNSSIYYSKVKGEVERDLKIIGFDYVAIFRPSLLMGNRSEFRLGESAAQILMKPLIWLKLFKNVRPIYDYQVAKALVRTALAKQSTSSEIISSGEMQDLSE